MQNLITSGLKTLQQFSTVWLFRLWSKDRLQRIKDSPYCIYNSIERGLMIFNRVLKVFVTQKKVKTHYLESFRTKFQFLSLVPKAFQSSAPGSSPCPHFLTRTLSLVFLNA